MVPPPIPIGTGQGDQPDSIPGPVLCCQAGKLAFCPSDFSVQRFHHRVQFWRCVIKPPPPRIDQAAGYAGLPQARTSRDFQVPLPGCRVNVGVEVVQLDAADTPRCRGEASQRVPTHPGTTTKVPTSGDAGHLAAAVTSATQLAVLRRDRHRRGLPAEPELPAQRDRPVSWPELSPNPRIRQVRSWPRSRQAAGAPDRRLRATRNRAGRDARYAQNAQLWVAETTPDPNDSDVRIGGSGATAPRRPQSPAATLA